MEFYIVHDYFIFVVENSQTDLNLSLKTYLTVTKVLACITIIFSAQSIPILYS